MTALINADTTSGVVVTSDTSGNLALQSAGTTKLTVSSSGVTTTGTTSLSNLTATGTFGGGVITSMTAQASTSGTNIDFTSIPSWVKRITVMFKGVSTNGSSAVIVQLGISSGVETTGYSGSVDFVEDNAAGTTFSTGFAIDKSLGASDLRTGHMTICLFGSNNWNETSVVSNTLTGLLLGAGDKTLSGTLDRVRITTVGGDTFDAGSINILYEG
jgi:hypothetical protein